MPVRPQAAIGVVLWRWGVRAHSDNRQYEYQIKKQTMTAASPRISHTMFFFIQYCHTNLCDRSSKRFDSSLMRRAFQEVCCKSSCLPSSRDIFSFMMSWMLSNSRFIRSTFLTEAGSSNQRFFSLIFRSNLMKYSSEVSVSSLDSQLAAVNCVRTQSKKGATRESRKAAASLRGQFLSAMSVKTTQLWTLQKTPNEELSMCLSAVWSLRLYCATSVRYLLTLCLTLSTCSSMQPSLDSQKVSPSANLPELAHPYSQSPILSLLLLYTYTECQNHIQDIQSLFSFIMPNQVAYLLFLIVSEKKRVLLGIEYIINAMKQTSNLHKVIDCLQQQQRLGLPRAQTGQDIEQIHNVTIGLLNSFGEQVERCKKYNEARIHRKYENTILILQQQNITLQRALQLERQAVPSSQAYVSDLIDRMVELRNTNDRLRQQNQALQNQISLYEAKKDLPVKQWETATQSQLSNESMLVRDVIGKYTRWRRQEGCRKEDHNLLRFLQFNSSKASKWTLFQLFQRLEKWMANMKDVRFLDSQRIRQNFERTHSSIEQSHPTLAIQQTMRTDGSRLGKLKTQNLGSFVNSRFTLVKKKPGHALHASLVRRELASTALSRSQKKQRRV